MSPIFIPSLGICIRWSLVTVCSHPFKSNHGFEQRLLFKERLRSGAEREQADLFTWEVGSSRFGDQNRLLLPEESKSVLLSKPVPPSSSLFMNHLPLLFFSCLLPDPLQQYHSHFHTQKQSHGTLKFALHVSDRWLSTGKVEKLDLGQLPWPCLVVNPCRRQSFRLQHSWAQPHPRESGRQLIQ